MYCIYFGNSLNEFKIIIDFRTLINIYRKDFNLEIPYSIYVRVFKCCIDPWKKRA